MKPSTSNGALFIVAAALVTLAVVLSNLASTMRVVWGRPLGSHYVRVDRLVFWWLLVAGLIVGLTATFKVLRSEGG